MATELPLGDAAPAGDAMPAPDAASVASSAPSPETPAVATDPLPDAAAASSSDAPTAAETPAADTPEAEAPAADEGSLVEAAPEPAADPAANAQGEPEQAAPEPITYEAFAFPEGVTVDEAAITPFTEVLGRHTASQELGQELIDLHTAQMQAYAETLQKQQVDAFAKTRETWRGEFEASAGNQRDTLLANAKSAINTAIPDEKDRKALWDVMSFTGAGDNPLVIRAFAALGAKLRERSAPPPSIPSNPARNGRPADRRYGAAQR